MLRNICIILSFKLQCVLINFSVTPNKSGICTFSRTDLAHLHLLQTFGVSVEEVGPKQDNPDKHEETSVFGEKLKASKQIMY